MAEVTFKNVGQGDSLIIEWSDDGKNKVGIIDVNKTKKTNPVISHLQDKGYIFIEFILLSHPHEDHYSGMLELLNYVDKSGITVGWFGHTIDKSLQQDYWRLFEISKSATIELEKLLEKAIQLKKKKVIEAFELPAKNWQISLSGSLSLKAVSPSSDEIELYQKRVKLSARTRRREASQAANLLSTVLILASSDNSVLITSDAEIFTLDRIYDQSNLKEIDISLIQVPHHGSKNNYSSNFWNNIKTKKRAVISAGHNLKYRHPDFEVLSDLDMLKYTIYSTNICHGMQTYVEAKRKSLLLDMISEIDESTFSAGDKSFNL